MKTISLLILSLLLISTTIFADQKGDQYDRKLKVAGEYTAKLLNNFAAIQLSKDAKENNTNEFDVSVATVGFVSWEDIIKIEMLKLHLRGFASMLELDPKSKIFVRALSEREKMMTPM